MRWASAIGSGMSSGVSRQAKPNIIPWSPAPSSPTSTASPRDLERRVDALGDVRRLLLDRDQRAAGLVVEAVVGARVADVADRLADDLLEVDVGLRRDLAEDDDEAGGGGRLAGDAGVGVVADDRVEDRVADLVAELVRVALGDRFGGEQVLGRVDDAGQGTLSSGLRLRTRREGTTGPVPPRLARRSCPGLGSGPMAPDVDRDATTASRSRGARRGRSARVFPAIGSSRPSRAWSTSTATRSAGRRRRRSSASPRLGEQWSTRLIRGWDDGWLEMPTDASATSSRRACSARSPGEVRSPTRRPSTCTASRPRRSTPGRGRRTIVDRALRVPDRPLHRRGPGAGAGPRDPLARRRPDRGPDDRRRRRGPRRGRRRCSSCRPSTTARPRHRRHPGRHRCGARRPARSSCGTCRTPPASIPVEPRTRTASTSRSAAPTST